MLDDYDNHLPGRNRRNRTRFFAPARHSGGGGRRPPPPPLRRHQN